MTGGTEKQNAWATEIKEKMLGKMVEDTRKMLTHFESTGFTAAGYVAGSPLDAAAWAMLADQLVDGGKEADALSLRGIVLLIEKDDAIYFINNRFGDWKTEVKNLLKKAGLLS